ncbi:hypothetical protein ACUDA6_13310 [Pseudomonas ceruminis]|uniref:hypothetical protein n=1 Tax=Pseudomonas TaxID=286 RepID=UPI001E068B02|nr:hypothetical protein [Pseudomonas sp.]MPT00389.1 hypothetical protein [Pseudomonas sp.]
MDLITVASLEECDQQDQVTGRSSGRGRTYRLAALELSGFDRSGITPVTSSSQTQSLEECDLRDGCEVAALTNPGMKQLAALALSGFDYSGINARTIESRGNVSPSRSH